MGAHKAMKRSNSNRSLRTKKNSLLLRLIKSKDMYKIKTKISGGTVAKYLRELSVVVIGIAITLSVSNWLSGRSEKKDMTLYLNAVKLEMEENLVELGWLTGKIEEEVSYSNYLLSHDKNALHSDSLQYYAPRSYSIRGMSSTSNAFEMFKTSGSMRFIKDKDILLSIWDAYYNLEMCEFQLVNYHNKEKYEEVKKEMQLKKEGKPVAVPMYDFYTSEMSFTFDMLDGCKRALSALEKGIARIGEKLR
jgi:hypothetical protein